jgi:hypothetical protein
MVLVLSWVLAPCIFLLRFQRFGETCCLHLQGWSDKDENWRVCVGFEEGRLSESGPSETRNMARSVQLCHFSDRSLSQARWIQSTVCNYISLKISFNTILPSTPTSFKWSFALRLPNQNSVRSSYLHMRATCPTTLILLDLITLIISYETYKLRSSSLCNFLQSPFTSSLYVQIFLSAPCSQRPSVCLVWKISFTVIQCNM